MQALKIYEEAYQLKNDASRPSLSNFKTKDEIKFGEKTWKDKVDNWTKKVT